MKKIIIHFNANRVSRIRLLDYDYYIQNIFIFNKICFHIISYHAKNNFLSHVLLNKLYKK